MKYLLVLALFLLSAFSQAGDSSNELPSKKLVIHLAKIDFLVESRKFPLTVRVFKESDFGECDGKKNCPKSRLYIIAMSHDEYPEINSYTTIDADNWEFIRWIKNAKEETDFTILELKMNDNENNKKSTCRLLINIFNAKISCEP